MVENAVFEAVFLPKHGTYWLSLSATARTHIYIFRNVFFKCLIDTGESLSFRNEIAWLIESR